LKQQDGYGEAESLLRFKHLIFFGPTGSAKWRGQIYGVPRSTWFINRPVIYHGIFGEGFFQSIYPTPESEVAAYLRSIEWFALTIFLFGLGIFLPALRIVPYLMLGGTLCVALSYMVRALIEPKFDTVHARLLVMLLAFAQPLVRGEFSGARKGEIVTTYWARSSNCLMKKAGVIPPIAGGMNGTFKFTGISGGASPCKRLLNITVTGNA
jgi:hypothetical protein